MIIFNGTELTNIAPVKIEDIQVSPISIAAVSRQRAIKFGSEFVRMSGSSRTITITFALLTENSADREADMQKIRDWARTDGEYNLELPEFSNRHLECVCTEHPEHSYRKWWENKLKIVFTCFNNVFWTSNDLIEVPCGTYFSIGGSATPLVRIERNGSTALGSVTYSNGIESMTFKPLPAGQMVIDLNRQLAYVGKTSIMSNYVNTSTFLVPRIGASQRITGTGTVKYRERWV